MRPFGRVLRVVESGVARARPAGFPPLPIGSFRAPKTDWDHRGASKRGAPSSKLATG